MRRVNDRQDGALGTATIVNRIRIYPIGQRPTYAIHDLVVAHKSSGTRDREEEPRIERIKRMSADRSVPIRTLRQIRGFLFSFDPI